MSCTRSMATTTQLDSQHISCSSSAGKTSQGLTIASLQRLKMEALIPAPTDCEVQSVIKFLNSQSIALIKIHQLDQVYGHTQLDDQHISCRSSAGKTSRGLTIASLQQLKMEALIPAPTDSEVRSVIKFLNSQSIALIKIHELYQVYGHTQLDVNTSPAGIWLGGV